METMGTSENNTQSNTTVTVAQIVPRTKGPRTATGKSRASGNATRHGVLSKAVLLKDDSRAEYQDLLDGLRKAFQPEGGLEDLLVEKLATSAWRLRRVLMAETAELETEVEFYVLGKRNVATTPEMDRLLRYETTLERSFDRTLSQLERTQRLRRGQPVPPEVKVRVTQEQ